MTKPRWGLLLIAGACLATVGIGPANAADPTPAPTALAPLATEVVDPPSLTPAVDQALTAAQQLAEANPDDFGIPTVGSDSTTVAVRVVGGTSLGASAVASLQASGSAASTFVPSRARVSWRQLTALSETAMAAGVTLPTGAVIYGGSIDANTQRIVLDLSSIDDATRAAVATTFGANVAVREGIPVTPQSRDQATSPYFAGSRVISTLPAKSNEGTVCTAGFALDNNRLLTAGHCSKVGEQRIWRVPYDSSAGNQWVRFGQSWGSTWAPFVGSVKVNTSIAARTGDAGQVLVDSGRSVKARVWVGGPTSTSSVYVTSAFTTVPNVGQQFCVSGATRGEVCGFKVTNPYSWYHPRLKNERDVWYTGPETIGWVTTGTKKGVCPIGGDSGAPVYYRAMSNPNAVKAMGILSSISTKDMSATPPADNPCSVFFTPVSTALSQMRGKVLTEPLP